MDRSLRSRTESSQRKPRTLALLVAGCCIVSAMPAVLSARPIAAEAWTVEADAPRVQVALLLDTSNSMDGLINQAKSQLWRIVNEFAKARKDGKPVSLKSPFMNTAMIQSPRAKVTFDRSSASPVISICCQKRCSHFAPTVATSSAAK